jgi:hypothetical protein
MNRDAMAIFDGCWRMVKVPCRTGRDLDLPPNIEVTCMNRDFFPFHLAGSCDGIPVYRMDAYCRATKRECSGDVFLPCQLLGEPA